MIMQEFKRAIKRNTFLFSVIILTAIGISGFLINTNLELSVRNYTEMFIMNSSYYSFLPCSLENTNVRNIYILILPVICSLAYSDSYFEDKKSGFINYICTRTTKKKYMAKKFMTNFIIGGVTAAIPLIINLILVLLFIPSIEVHPIIGYAVVEPDYLFSNIYYYNPIIYAIIWIGIYFLYGGAYASVSLSTSRWVKNKIIIIISSFIIINSISLIMELTHYNLPEPSSLYGMGYYSFGIIIGEFLFIMIISFISFMIGGKYEKL